MPFQPLMSRLHVKAQGRILQADRPIPASLKASARDSKEQIEVEGPDGKLRKRALYVDYQLPFENQNS